MGAGGHVPGDTQALFSGAFSGLPGSESPGEPTSRRFRTGTSIDPKAVHRRNFLKHAGAAGLAALAGSSVAVRSVRALQAPADDGQAQSADALLNRRAASALDPADLREMARLMPNARCAVCEDGSHLALWDDQAAYFLRLLGFLHGV